jgi:hypothetical protein
MMTTVVVVEEMRDSGRVEMKYFLCDFNSPTIVKVRRKRFICEVK